MQAFTIRILIINSNHSVRKGLAALFEAQSSCGFQVVGDFQSSEDIEYLQRLQPDVVLHGLYSHDEKSMSAINRLKEACPCTLLIVLSDLNESSHIPAVLAAGADSYLRTPVLPADLVATVKLACSSEICFIPRWAKESLLSVKGMH